MSKPVIFAVEDDEVSRRRMERELNRRYTADYEIVVASTAEDGLEKLKKLADEGRDVAVLLVDCWLPDLGGVGFFRQARSYHPDAHRLLMIDVGDKSPSLVIMNAISLNQIDAYGNKPMNDPDEGFHKFLTAFLSDWAAEHRPQFQFVKIVGDRWARRCHELRDLLDRNAIPYGFYPADTPEAHDLLEEAGVPNAPLPVVIFFNGQVIPRPTNTQLADAVNEATIFDASGSSGPIEAPVDLLIIGAGPAGLSAAVYGASEGLQTVIVEREAIGGQAGMSSRIRNYLGFPTGISGGELAMRAYQQAWLFGADFIFTQEATGLKPKGDKWVVTLSDGTEITSCAVILAMGVKYRRLGIPGLDKVHGAGVYYGAVSSEARALRGEKVFVVGGGNSAGQAALHLAHYAENVNLVARGESLANTMSDYLIQEIQACPNIRLRLQSEIITCGGNYRLEWLEVRNNSSGDCEREPAGALFITVGATPYTSWLPKELVRDESGFIYTGEDLLQENRLPDHWVEQRQPMLLETSLPGVFAAGDVRHGSMKRVASAVGDGSIAVSLVHQFLER